VVEQAGGSSARDPDLYASAFLLAVAAAASVGAYRLGLGSVHNPGPGFMPFAVATLLALMALGQLVRGVMAPAERGSRAAPFATSRWGVVTIVLGTLVGAGFLFERAGFSLATFLMLVALFGVVARNPWWVTLLSAALVVAAARLLARALGVPLPEGPLGL
jgi:putative tricarboxylic transport membrane protein